MLERFRRNLTLFRARRHAPKPHLNLSASHAGIYFRHPIGIQLTTDTDLEFWAAIGFAFAEIQAPAAVRLHARPLPLPVGVDALRGSAPILMRGDWFTYSTALAPEHWPEQRPLAVRMDGAVVRQSVHPSAQLIRLVNANAVDAPRYITNIYRLTSGRVPIISGGVESAADAKARIEAGAALLVVDPLTYLRNGAGIVRSIVTELNNIVAQGRIRRLIGKSALGSA